MEARETATSNLIITKKLFKIFTTNGVSLYKRKASSEQRKSL